MNLDFFQKQTTKVMILYLVVVSVIMKILKIFNFYFQINSQKVFVASWFGELGNNLIQLVHAQYLANKLHTSICVPKHDFLMVSGYYDNHNMQHSSFLKERKNLSYFTGAFLGAWGYNLLDHINQKIEFSQIFSPLIRDFYYTFDVLPFNINLSDYREILKSDLLNIIAYNHDQTITDDTLVIHIRSGDIFDDTNLTHRAYIQPPVSFYLKIIEQHQYQSVIIVTQPDYKNPCIDQLKQLFPQVKIQSKSINQDVSTILSAKHLVVAMSSFSLALAFASPNIENLYVPVFDISKKFEKKLFFWSELMRLCQYKFNKIHLDFNIYQIKINNYIKIGEWCNNKQQREIMINHSQEDLDCL